SACDVVCLQELKVNDDEFPRDAFEAGGGRCAVHGQRTYNGVAILSRTPLGRVSAGLGDGVADQEARLLSADVAGVRIVSAYVPNGQTVGSPKWEYKLLWLGRLRRWLERTAAPGPTRAPPGGFHSGPAARGVR